MPKHFEKYKGYVRDLARAEREDARQREAPFLGIPLKICGIEVQHFTPRHFSRLCAVGSPFLMGGRPEPEDVAMFLWSISTAFRPDKQAASAFIRRVSRVPYIRAVAAIDEYIDFAFIDRPPGEVSAGKSSPMASFPASLVHEIASAYGWTRDQILDTAFIELFQYIRLIARDDHARRGKKYLATSTRALRVRRKWADKLTKGGR